MATDYRFAIQCWQDSAGSEDAKINIFVDSTQVATDVVITATSDSSPQVVSFEATGLPDPNTDGSVTCAIRVVLTNEYFVDANTDRNVWINSIRHIDKSIDGDYWGAVNKPTTDFTNLSEYIIQEIPTAVTGDQIPDDFWDAAVSSDTFYHIPIFGSYLNTDGVTITYKLTPITYST